MNSFIFIGKSAINVLNFAPGTGKSTINVLHIAQGTGKSTINVLHIAPGTGKSTINVLHIAPGTGKSITVYKMNSNVKSVNQSRTKNLHLLTGLVSNLDILFTTSDVLDVPCAMRPS